MKFYPMPVEFDGAKFAARYGLSSLNGDFGQTFINQQAMFFVRPTIPDDPPIFEPPDPPGPTLEEQVVALEQRIADLESRLPAEAVTNQP